MTPSVSAVPHLKWRCVTLTRGERQRMIHQKRGIQLNVVIHWVLLWHCNITPLKGFCFHSKLLKVFLLPCFFLCSQTLPVVLKAHQSVLTQGHACQFIDACRLLQLCHLLFTHPHSQVWKPADQKSCSMMCLPWVLNLSVLSKQSPLFDSFCALLKGNFASLLKVNRTAPKKNLTVPQ